MARQPIEEDVELGDRESDAFLPQSNESPEPAKQPHSSVKSLPLRLVLILGTIQKVKIVVFLLAVFLFSLAWIVFSNIKTPIKIPPESQALQAKLLTELERTNIPDYVITYAPLVFLDKSDHYYPSDLTKHIKKTHPKLNLTDIDSKDLPKKLTLDNLDKLNDLGGENVYLTSTEDLFKFPKFLKGKKPNAKTLQTHKAKSAAIVVVDKENGYIDAFYMYFYTYNAGPSALGHTAGNHLGDWEHNMIRFKDGKPQAVWYSQHEYGAAYSYATLQKVQSKPIVYSARGSHANYAKSGRHDFHDQVPEIPAHIVFDHTSAGTLWDPTISAYFYTFHASNDTFTPAQPDTPTAWLYFNGRWGDPEYPDSKPGQEAFHGFHKWTAGPQGPLFKHLDRKDVCPPSNKTTCTILERL